MAKFIVITVDHDEQQTFVDFTSADSRGARYGAQAPGLLLSRRGLHAG